MKHVLLFGGFFIIYVAADLFRKKESKINFGTKEWFIQMILITLGGIMISTYGGME
jgi:uncharacterized membrane protein YsdA (DUF1294 family)